ncbi:MAG: hypothetical protein ABFD97_04950 [Syntrophobacter sp.]
MKGLSKLFFCLLVFCSFGFLGQNNANSAEPPPPASVSAPGSTSAPSILVQKDDFDFGEVLETEPISHDFMVRNDSRVELHIRDVSPS